MKRIAVIGGGLAGALTVIQLARSAHAKLEIEVYEPSASVGRGIAYATPHAYHQLNGPARAFSLRPEEPDHFCDWLKKRAHPQASSVNAARALFVPRGLYGDYIEDELGHALNDAPGITFRHRKTWVDKLEANAAGFTLAARDGSTSQAESAVLAIGSFRSHTRIPTSPGLADSEHYLHDPWNSHWPARLAKLRDVGIIGTGLTMVDTIAALQANGFEGNCHIFSRHALIPEAHAGIIDTDTVWNGGQAPASLRRAISEVRAAMRRIEASGRSWQAIVPGVRNQLRAAWPTLSLAQRQQFLRHMPRFLDIFLHRAPPEGAATLIAMRQQGRLRTVAGAVTRLETAGNDRVRVISRPRSAATTKAMEVDLVVNASGFEFDWTRANAPLARKLLSASLVEPHPLRQGIRVNPATQGVVTRNPDAAGRLFALGAPLRGELLESLSVSALLDQSARLASAMLAAQAS